MFIEHQNVRISRRIPTSEISKSTHGVVSSDVGLHGYATDHPVFSDVTVTSENSCTVSKSTAYVRRRYAVVNLSTNISYMKPEAKVDWLESVAVAALLSVPAGGQESTRPTCPLSTITRQSTRVATMLCASACNEISNLRWR